MIIVLYIYNLVSIEATKQMKMYQKENYYYQLVSQELEEKNQKDNAVIKKLEERNKSLLTELCNLKKYINSRNDNSIPKSVKINRSKLKELKEVKVYNYYNY